MPVYLANGATPVPTALFLFGRCETRLETQSCEASTTGGTVGVPHCF